MPAFKVQLNSKKLCVAGLDGVGVLGAHVCYICHNGTRQNQALSLHVGGLDSATGEHLVWHEDHPLSIGDKLTIEVVPAARSDKPLSRRKSDPTATLRAQKQYVRRMAKKFGWKIQAK